MTEKHCIMSDLLPLAVSGGESKNIWGRESMVNDYPGTRWVRAIQFMWRACTRVHPERATELARRVNEEPSPGQSDAPTGAERHPG